MSPSLPEHLSPVVQAALTDATAALRALYGERLRHLVLYGSQARGDVHDESDVDVLVVLDGEVDYAAELRRMLDLKMSILLRDEILLSLKPIALTLYQNEHHPLMMNVHREGADYDVNPVFEEAAVADLIADVARFVEAVETLLDDA